MTCQMPSLNLTKQFDDQLRANTTSTIPTRSQDTAVSVINGTTSGDVALVYLGFKFDGYNRYGDVNQVLKNVSLNFLPGPIIQFSNDIIEFNPDIDNYISILVGLCNHISL